MSASIIVRSALSLEAERFDPPLTSAEQEQAWKRFEKFSRLMPDDEAYTEMLRTLRLETLRK